MGDIAKQALKGDVIEPFSIRDRLRNHCEYAASSSQNGDYFHMLAQDALTEIDRLRAGLQRIVDLNRPASRTAVREFALETLENREP